MELTNNKELQEAEVNMYIDDCGQAMHHCITDCIIVGTSWLNPDK